MIDREKLTGWVEIAAAAVISLAAALTSWAGFQAALWDGEQAAHYAQAGATRVAATRAATLGGQLETDDLLMFQQWLSATAEGHPKLQIFYRQRFRKEFAVAFEAWLAGNPLENPTDPPTPFAMPQYHSTRLAQADALFDRGQRDNDISDRFVRGTVLLAIALFFGGISQTFRSPLVKAVLIAIAFVICVLTAIQIAQLPILHLSPF